MADVTEATADPSMEEILASIRKIISDDKPAEPSATEASVTPIADDDVVELTHMVQDDGSVVDLSASGEPAAPISPPEPQPVSPPPPSPASPPPPPTQPPPPPVAASESLVSGTVAQTAASALSSLANAAEIERLSSAPVGTTFIGNGSRTLEDMVIELMRPLLKDWLDQNLPAVVERLVQKEIERIARRS